MSFIDSDGVHKRPYMVHRAIFGSLERFFGVLVEHFGGYFPLWIAPVQAIVLPITDKQMEYAGRVVEQFRAAGIRTELDDRSEKVGFKIREAETQKIPYMVVVGDKEIQSSSASVRHHGEGDQGVFPIDTIIERLTNEIKSRALPPQLGS